MENKYGEKIVEVKRRSKVFISDYQKFKLILNIINYGVDSEKITGAKYTFEQLFSETFRLGVGKMAELYGLEEHMKKIDKLFGGEKDSEL